MMVRTDLRGLRQVFLNTMMYSVFLRRKKVKVAYKIILLYLNEIIVPKSHTIVL